MSVRNRDRFLLLIGLAFFVAGLTFIAGSARALAIAKQRIERTAGYAEELKVLDEQSSGFRDLGKRLQAEGGAEVVHIDRLLAEHLPDVTSESRSEKRRLIASRWAVRDLTLTFSEAPMGKVMRFVHASESLRPPWRMTACELRAVPGAPGKGRVKLTLSSLEYGP